ncbi:short chain dehydrogenase [Aquimarina sp. I32.4]|uniref:short chain dehydrogenase n=1 Tax=Aquimarina sp. I32.4 TaxID=2053903 RepID=UPI000CDE8404|nr:short chain dehydrogenase [Aquimarina sp. I32.4]
MKILIISATGMIGSAVYNTLKEQYSEVFGAHRNSVSYPIDITNKSSIEKLFKNLPKLDAVINAAGTAVWKPFSELSEQDYYTGIRSKLMGQINLVHIAQEYLNDSASITLTTGILAEHYEPNTTALSFIYGAIHSFINTVSNELKRGIRLNAVAPGAIAGDFPNNQKFAGHFPVTIQDVVACYKQLLINKSTGTIYKKY